MKKIKITVQKVAAIFCLFAFVAFSASAIASKNNEKEAVNTKRVTTWYFEGTDINQANQASQYTMQDPNLGCGSGESLPCEILVEADNEEELTEFFSDKTGLQVRDDHASSLRD